MRAGLMVVAAERTRLCRSYLAEFLNEALLMGEEGYALATLQTALEYIESLNVPPPATQR